MFEVAWQVTSEACVIAHALFADTTSSCVCCSSCASNSSNSVRHDLQSSPVCIRYPARHRPTHVHSCSSNCSPFSCFLPSCLHFVDFDSRSHRPVRIEAASTQSLVCMTTASASRPQQQTKSCREKTRDSITHIHVLRSTLRVPMQYHDPY